MQIWCRDEPELVGFSFWQNLNEIIHPKIKIISSFTHPDVIPKLFDTKPLTHFSKYCLLRTTEKWITNKFIMTWGWINTRNYDTIFYPKLSCYSLFNSFLKLIPKTVVFFPWKHLPFTFLFVGGITALRKTHVGTLTGWVVSMMCLSGPLSRARRKAVLEEYNWNHHWRLRKTELPSEHIGTDKVTVDLNWAPLQRDGL